MFSAQNAQRPAPRRPPPRPKPVAVVRGYKYVAPEDVARKILQTRRLCQSESSCYLDCVVRWAEVRELTALFAAALQAPDLCEPDAFLAWHRSRYK